MPLFELLEQHSVWETLTTDSDAFQNTITPQLVKDEMGLDFASLQQRTEKHNQLITHINFNFLLIFMWDD